MNQKTGLHVAEFSLCFRVYVGEKLFHVCTDIAIGIDDGGGGGGEVWSGFLRFLSERTKKWLSLESSASS